MSQHIIVKDYCNLWEKMFKQEQKLIGQILQDNCLYIYHIGSTAVKGLKAKPIIDIMPVVKDLEKVDDLKNKFEQIGYEYLGEFGIDGRRYLRKGGDERTHQIHMFSADNKKEIERHLAVRDYLRTHKKIADEYGVLKQKLALKFPYDINGYCEGKENFVKELERKAILWKQKSFYSESNIRHLQKIKSDIADGKAKFLEHDLID